MEPSKKCLFVPKNDFPQVGYNDLKTGTSDVTYNLITLRSRKYRDHMEPSKKCIFPKVIYFIKQAQNLKMGTS